MKTRKLSVLVLSLAMVLTMSLSVFAANNNPNNVTTNSTHVVYLTKEFDVPQGVDVPTDQFEFTVTPVVPAAGNSEVDLVGASDYPDMSFAKISFDNDSRAKAEDTVLVKSSSVDFDTLTYPRAGLYKWTVTEEAGSNDKITYTSGEYIIRVYVKNGTNGPVVDSITVQTPGGDKIDAGKEDKEETKDADNDGSLTNDGNDFRFVNKYKPQDVTTNPDDPNTPTDPTDDTGAFKLTKAAVGDYADKSYEFTFNVDVTLPAGVNAADYPTGITGGQVKLADGGTFSIPKLPEGTLITVSEEGTAHYTPSYTGKHTQAGAAVDLTVATANKGEGLAVAQTIVVGSKGANVAYTNTFEDSDVTFTGIVINNLPYVLLIAIALGGIVLFSRKRRYE